MPPTVNPKPPDPPRPDPPRPGRPGTHPDHDLPDPPHPEPRRPERSEPEPHERPSARAAEPESPAKSARAPRTAEPTSVLSGLLPSSAAVGDPSFMLRVVGTLFDATSIIVVAGQDEETNFVSPEELTTGMNMDVWLGPDPAIPVLVRTAGVESNTLLFNMTPPREVPLDPAHASTPIPLMDQI